jgi:TRAP-type mannitol/chloroaromatic compound transport system substrate-binding protein
MPKIIISYRRVDSAAMAGRIFDRLHAHFGDDSMFMDIDSIPFGSDFRQFISEAIRNSDVIVAVVGPRWLGPRDAVRPRIHDATDPVRLEIEAALARGMPIVPVLVDGARMPSDEDLPDALKDFAFINAAAVDTGRDFQQHVQRLIRGIEDILAKTAEARPSAAGERPPPSDRSSARPEPATREADTRPATVEAAAASAPPAPPARSPTQQPEVGIGNAPVEASAVRRYLYPVLAAALVAGIGVIALLSWDRGSDSGERPKSVSRIELTPSADPIPSNVANRRETNAPPLAPAKIDSQPPANAVAAREPQGVEASRPRLESLDAPLIRWKLQNTLPAETPTALPQFARRVAELSGGRMKIELFAAGAVAPAFQVPDAVQAGVLDLGLLSGSFMYGKNRAFALMSAVPFGFAPAEQLEFRQRAAPVFDRLLEQQNAVALPCGSFGRNGELWLKQRLASTADLRSGKLRVLGLAADVYRELGSTVAVLPTAEIVAAFDKGLITGAQYGAPSDAEALGLPAIARYFYHPGVVTPSTLLDLYVAKRKWEALGQAGQKIIEQACGEVLAAMRAERERADAAALDELPRRGVTVWALPAPIVRDLYAASGKVLTRFSDENPGFRAAMAIVEDMRGRTLAARLR